MTELRKDSNIFIEADVLEALRKEWAWEDELFLGDFGPEEDDEDILAWLADPSNKDDVNYSDIYKDVYGVRPRW